jgi:hypothetical protein
MPRALKSAAIALLDVRPSSMQRSMCGARLGFRFATIDLGLLRIAKPDAARLGRSEDMARALADHVPLVLGNGGEHDGARHVGNPLESINVAMNATLRESRSSFATSSVALRFLAAPSQRPVAALAASTSTNSRSVRHGGLRDSAAQPRAAPRRKTRAIVDNTRQERSLSSMVKP